MYTLAAGLIVFIGIHMVPSITALRKNLIVRFGAGPYKIIYSVIAVAGLALIIIGKSKSGYQPVWEPPPWAWYVTMVMMVPAAILFPAAKMPSNIKRYTRHPMLWAVVLWSASHLLSNGDLASIILFGSLGLFALFDMVSANRRGAVKQITTCPPVKDVIVVVTGVIAYILLVMLHAYLFGIAVVI